MLGDYESEILEQWDEYCDDDRETEDIDDVPTWFIDDFFANLEAGDADAAYERMRDSAYGL